MINFDENKNAIPINGKNTAKSSHPVARTISSIWQLAQQKLNHFFIVLLVLASVIFLIRSTIILSQDSDGEYALEHPLVFVDKQAVYSLSNILSLPESDWKPSDSLQFSALDGQAWLKIRIPEGANNQSLVLRLQDPQLDKVFMKIVDQSTDRSVVISELTTGDTFSFAHREVLLPHFVQAFKLGKGEYWIYLSATSKISVDLQFGLWNEQRFIAFNDELTLFNGIVFGYILALACYSFMLWSSVRKPEYKWFGLYLATFLLYVLTIGGYGYQYIWPTLPVFQSVVSGVSMSLAFSCLIKFTLKIVEPKRVLHSFVFNGSLYTHLALCCFSLLLLNPSIARVHFLFTVFTCLLLPFGCYLMVRDNVKSAKICLFVWVLIAITLLTSTLDFLHIISLKIESVFILFIGFHIVTLVIGAGLMARYRQSIGETLSLKQAARHDKEKTIAAKNQILDVQQAAQELLQKQVKAQTMQLEKALSDLSMASKELKVMRNVDGLTCLPNRLAFEEAVERLSKICITSGRPLCVAVIDIDHFKRVNDNYGHKAGDDCLRAFSILLQNTFSKQDYEYCRFGGEEFFVASLLPLEQVKNQLNHFRKLVESHTVDSGGHSISFTTSAGVSAKRILIMSDTMRLYSKADENLYIAKQKGRNLILA